MSREIVIGVSKDPVRSTDLLRMMKSIRFVPWNETTEAEVLWRRHGDSTIDLVGAVTSNASVRWIHMDNVGLDRLPIAAWRDQKIRVSNGRGLNTTQVAEWTLGAMLLAIRRLDITVRLSDAGRWENIAERITTLRGRRIVILGVGSVGTRVAELSKAFGAHITGVVDQQPSIHDSRRQVVDRLVTMENIAEVCTGAELLVICAPLTEQTRASVSGEILDKLSDTAWVVNAARGEIVDEQALAAAIRDQRLGGAVLDVAAQEPPATDSTLWGHSSIILSAHLADHPRVDNQQSSARFYAELYRYVNGKQLENEVDLERGY